MGFGATFEAQAQARPNERANYVRYAAFKEKLLAMAAKGNLRRDSAAREGFARDYQAEVDRLTRFAGSSVESIWMRIDLVHGELHAEPELDLEIKAPAGLYLLKLSQANGESLFLKLLKN